MRIMRLKKRSGGERVIYAPSRKEKTALRGLIPALQTIAESVDTHGCAHGFRRGRNTVTGAEQHRGFRYTVSLDLTDFFATVTPAHVAAHDVPAECFVDGAARQGLPTSPIVANIAAAPMDAEIIAWLAGRAAYSRYADDLSFSFDDQALIPDILATVAGIAARHGFTVAKHKTQVQDSRHGRRVITGIAVDDSLHATRGLRRRLRAAQHAVAKGTGNPAKANGLAEANAIKPPNAGKLPRRERNKVRRILYRMDQKGLDPVDVMQRMARLETA